MLLLFVLNIKKKYREGNRKCLVIEGCYLRCNHSSPPAAGKRD